MKKGFTLVELMAVIAIMAVLSMLVLPNIINIFSENVDKVMKTQEANIFDSAKLYIQDYCTHPINQDYRNHCNSNFKDLDSTSNKKYLCIKALQEKEIIDSVLYKDVPCSGLVVLEPNEKGVYDKGQTYLYCGRAGNYDYETEGGSSYESYLTSCN